MRVAQLTEPCQGGVFDEEQMREVEKDPWLQDKLMVRRWDDLAKEPEKQTFPLSYYEQMAVDNLRCELDR